MWIDQQVLLNQIQIHITDEKVYQDRILQLKTQIKALDVSIHEKLNVIVGNLTNQTITSDAGLPYAQFESRNMLADTTFQVQYTSEMIYSHPIILIEIEGAMQRKSTIRKIWKSAYYVLTTVRTHKSYLHTLTKRLVSYIALLLLTMTLFILKCFLQILSTVSI